MLSDFNAPGNDWIYETAPEASFGRQILEIEHTSKMVENFNQVAR